jgi:hypothetical protein
MSNERLRAQPDGSGGGSAGAYACTQSLPHGPDLFVPLDAATAIHLVVLAA